MTVFILALLALSPGKASAQVPKPTGYVNDLAGVIPASGEARIESIARALKKNNGAEIAVLTVPTTNGKPIFDYTLEVFDQWKVGREGVDDGLLIVVAVQDRQMFVATGYGLEGILPAARVGNIKDRFMVPHFKQGDYGRGILSGVAVYAAAIDPKNESLYMSRTGIMSSLPENYDQPPPDAGRPTIINYIFLGIMAVAFVYMAIFHPRLLLLLLIFGRGGGYRSGGGFSGGFGGFGGGGFGGGGAGGSW